MSRRPDQTFDVVIVGAGVSGIDAAYRVQEKCPGKTFTILEGRQEIGGTWDLFKFPGIRSDSDMHTLGFPFKPWNQGNTIAEAPMIMRYLKETMSEFGLNKHLQLAHKVDSADWSTEQQKWTLTTTVNGEKQKIIQCQYFFVCTGYYDYHNPLSVDIPGLSNFKGTIVHPQFWPENFEYTDKKVVIIGSGATAITVMPNMAKHTPHVTMLQRSPSWVVAMPQNDAITKFLRFTLPKSWFHTAIRWRFIMLAYVSFTVFQAFPNFARKVLRKRTAEQLPKDYPLDPNFNPNYNPWDQRLCISPGGDFFKAIRDKRADIVTATIKNIDETTIHLHNSDIKLKPDIIVTATGLKLQMAGGAALSVDGQRIDPSEKFVYRHGMMQDVPNLGVFVGYANASWTLGSDSTAIWMCRLINHCDKTRLTSATPRVEGPMEEKPIFSLTSTYVKAAKSVMPRAGNRAPWTPRTWYAKDLWEAKHGDFRELEFRSGGYSDDERKDSGLEK